MRLLFAILALTAFCAGHQARALDSAVWAAARTALVAADGRVVDDGNGGVTHSEGQGYAMLLAEAAGDRQTFDRAWAWTQANLARPDALFSWKYDPAATPPVADPNNATDGDILIAWALMRAAARWSEPAFEAAAAPIRAAIREKLVRQVAGRSVLLPGLAGFEDERGVTLNLSYLIFPALKAFARAEPQAGWETVVGDGLALVQDARFGRFALNPDWLRLGGDGYLSPAPGLPPRFGFDAVRIPLYLLWGGEARGETTGPYAALWHQLRAQGRPLPGWIDLRDGAFADYAGPPGFGAVERLTLGLPAAPPAPAESYYSTMLGLPAAVAADEQALYR